MKVIVGLGNPGAEYAQTRHNIGFMVLDELARRAGSPKSQRRFRGELREIVIAGEKTLLVAPMTYMNASGQTVSEVMRWHRLDPDELLVIADDLNLPFGTLRLRERGSAGGHNGITSIIQAVGTGEFPRLRVGIGKGPGAMHAHVLSRFREEERASLPTLIESAADAATLWASQGAVAAMNIVNQRLVEMPEAEPNTSGSAEVQS